jgi:hypothetical protein
MARYTFALFCLAAGAVSAYYTQPYVHHNSDLVLIVVTVFTVFAGFLIAIITIIGDPALIPDGSWRAAEGGRLRMEQRLTTHVTLFFMYLVTIGFLFVGVVLDKALTEQSLWKIWIDRAYLFLGVSSFLFTFARPVAMFQLHAARYDLETERRRREVGLTDSTNPDS